MKFRHEYKHEISYIDSFSLISRLGAVMQQDRYAKDGKYEIRSLYFDTPSDRALREKSDGVNKREKFRLRLYNRDTSFIVLEKKSKINGLCSKLQQQVTIDEVNLILKGDLQALKACNKPLVNEFCFKMQTQLLKPKTIVEYTRAPFVFRAGNVRVTVDYNLRTGLFKTDFLNEDLVTVPASETTAILEVKWDEYLPSIIRDIIQTPNTHLTAFSKYAICRTYD